MNEKVRWLSPAVDAETRAFSADLESHRTNISFYLPQNRTLTRTTGDTGPDCVADPWRLFVKPRLAKRVKLNRFCDDVKTYRSGNWDRRVIALIMDLTDGRNLLPSYDP